MRVIVVQGNNRALELMQIVLLMDRLLQRNFKVRRLDFLKWGHLKRKEMKDWLLASSNHVAIWHRYAYSYIEKGRDIRRLSSFLQWNDNLDRILKPERPELIISLRDRTVQAEEPLQSARKAKAIGKLSKEFEVLREMEIRTWKNYVDLNPGHIIDCNTLVAIRDHIDIHNKVL